MENTPDKNVKKKKAKGPIRYEAIVPVLILWALTFLYFSFYFDRHLKSVVEYVGTQINGAEVNVDNINTSFIGGSFDLNRLQVTNKERPKLNSLEIGNINFKFTWDALLRMKFVVDNASIDNVQLNKPRKTPGRVLPIEPARPSKLNQLQNEVLAQVKNKYSSNMLGDLISVLEGGDYKSQLEKIRGELKSEQRVNSMIADVNTKKEFWDNKVKSLSDTSKLKEIELQVNAISKDKAVINQVQGVQKLNGLLKEVETQYKSIETATKELQNEVNAVTKYPAQLQELINQDIASLKQRFSIPQLDFKDMALHLFAGQFAEYIAKARKYQAVAEQYMPEKKEDEAEEVVPRKRADGKYYDFPITTGYPLFWLKRAAISSKGTEESYSGNVAGELTNVTTDAKVVKKPAILDLSGDFPAAKIMGVKAILTLDHTKEIAKQSAFIQVNSFAVPKKLFFNDNNFTFGFKDAIGASTINATMIENEIDMSWNAALNKPNFIVETKSALAKEMFNNVLSSIPVISIDGKATGPFSNLKLSLNSNLGQELGTGFKRELGAKVAQAQDQIRTLIDEKIQKPKEQLLAQIGATKTNLSDLGNLQTLYKNNEDRIKAEIEKLKKQGTSKAVDDLKNQGKKLFKGIKL